jgi:hypothetical protein
MGSTFSFCVYTGKNCGVGGCGIGSGASGYPVGLDTFMPAQTFGDVGCDLRRVTKKLCGVKVPFRESRSEAARGEQLGMRKMFSASELVRCSQYVHKQLTINNLPKQSLDALACSCEAFHVL